MKSRVEPDQPLVSSLLDRLIDDDPSREREPIPAQNQVLATLRASVRRDLEHLLNTRWRAESWPAEYRELRRSVVGYGIPDTAASDLVSDRSRARFVRLIRETIELFEPRFLRVTVHLLDTDDYLDRTLRFRIDAVLRAFPAPEPVVFDSELETETGTFEIRGVRR